MNVPENLLGVTGVRPMHRKTVRKASKVLVREDYDTTLPTTQEARDIVRGMRQEIEAKELQLNKLREMLARQDETDISQAQAELNRLQAAFARVEEECEARLRPIQRDHDKQLAELEGKRTFCESLDKTAQERREYLEQLREKTQTTIFSLDDPKVTEVSEKPLMHSVNELSQLRTEVGALKRTLTLEKYAQSEMGKLNENLKRALKQATEELKMAQLNLNSAKQDIDVRRTAPKIQPIDDSWCEAKKTLEYNQILLTEANNSLTRYNEEARKIEESNRNLVEESRQLREELIILNRYVPDSTTAAGASTRAELSTEQLKIEQLKAKIDTLNAKIKTQKGRLKPLTAKLEELPPKIESEQKRLEALQKKRIEAEEELTAVQTRRSELMAELQFGNDQLETMRERVVRQTERLAEIEKRTTTAAETLKKQELIMRMNDEMQNLRAMDFNRITNIVSNLLAIQEEADSTN